VLLGDQSNKHFSQYGRFYDLDTLQNEYSKQFAGLYRHMSSNNPRFEFICIERWFLLYEYMVRENIKACVHIDSDVMVYPNLDAIVADYLKKAIACYHIIEQEYESMRWVASAGFSFWTREGLKRFCEFVIQQYRQGMQELESKWNWHCDTGRRGGICDMSLLYLFYRKHPEHILNLAPVADNAFCFDGNIASGTNFHADEFKVKRTIFGDYIKQITFIDHEPYGYHLLLKKRIAFYCLHCQGKFKILMFWYYTGERTWTDISEYLHFAAPFIWSRFKELIRYKLGTSGR
jgi:hypothetical protein